MKVINKKTGNIAELSGIICKGDITYMRFDDEKGKFKFAVHSLAELNKEWEDYEEPKTFFTIYYDGMISEFKGGDNEQIRDMKEIGNYFETREEAEKAVEKLKAWKRLKDKGFRFNGYSHYDWNGNESPAIAFEYSDFDKMFDDKQVVADLDLLFGGEE